MIVLLDNQDSFVYNLMDALAEYESVVFRNTVDTDSILALAPDLIVLSPGPGYPADAGCMPELIRRAQGKVPMLGICLDYQGLVEHFRQGPAVRTRPRGVGHYDADLGEPCVRTLRRQIHRTAVPPRIDPHTRRPDDAAPVRQ